MDFKPQCLHNMVTCFAPYLSCPTLCTVNNFRIKYRLLEPLLRGLPVYNVPDGIEVFGLLVAILKIIGMLPGVDSKETK